MSEGEQTPVERIGEWSDDQVHRVQISERMLEELFAHGVATTAGSSLVGPDLLVLESVSEAEEAAGIPPKYLLINDDGNVEGLRAALEDGTELQCRHSHGGVRMTADGPSEGGTERDWWAEQGHVLRKSESGNLWHVTGRFEDVDDGTRKYELQDDTHTVREYWYAEDVEDCFEKTSAVVIHSRKPVQVLDGRLYGNAFDDDRSVRTGTDGGERGDRDV